jgi:NADH:quinone reductase (non-electrogenic)
VKGTRGREGLQNGDPEHGIWSAGMVQGLIHDVPSVRELIDRIMAEAEGLIRERLERALAA